MEHRELTIEERATNDETRKHIAQVRSLLDAVVVELIRRGQEHDASKLRDPEVKTFTEMTPKLRDSTYGGDEYRGFLREMKPALDHHYASNRHHPEHFEDGVRGMTLVDLVEMLCDWKAATMRHADGDLAKSLDINERRFDIPPGLMQVLRNTAAELGWTA